MFMKVCLPYPTRYWEFVTWYTSVHCKTQGRVKDSKGKGGRREIHATSDEISGKLLHLTIFRRDELIGRRAKQS
jgi:hypothetical protein